jgi:hypothetical protein
MQQSNAPALVVEPWAAGAGASYIHTVPVPSQIGITNGAASWTDGFPPLTFQPVNTGGVPPDGRDVNGVLNALSLINQWQQAGGLPTYSSTFSTAIGGYPNGAILQSADGTGFWRSTVDNNTANPDTGGANWLPVLSYGLASIALSNTNVTLTAIQAAKTIIVLTGTLTGNVQVIFPTIVGEWLVQNNTTGAFTITAKTSGGTGVAVTQGQPTQVWGDGTNIYGTNAAPLQTAQVRLNYVSATQIALIPFGGNKLFNPASGIQTIPSAGTTAANTGVYVNGVAAQNLAASTCYLVFEFSNAGTPTLDFVPYATGYTTDANTGMPIKTGDNSRVLVGMVATNGSSQFVQSTSAIQVISYWNRQNIRGYAGNASNVTTTSVSFVAASGYLISYIQWAGEGVMFNGGGNVNNNTAGQATGVVIGIDSTSSGIGAAGTFVSTTASLAGSVFGGGTNSSAEGVVHNVTLNFNASAGTATVVGNQASVNLLTRG